MDLQQIIKQTETLSISEQKSLLSYFLIKFLQPDSNSLQALLNDGSLYLENNQKKSARKRVLKHKSFVDFGGSLDNQNIRDLAYE